MLFNSLPFLVFLPTVFILFWSLNGARKSQNILLLLASYVFYGWWDYRFLLLIAISTLIDFFLGLQMENQSRKKRKILLGISLMANIGLLGFFKYYNFFIESWVDAWEGLGINTELSTINIILPVGISFYTFQTLSYTIDVYKKRIPPTRNIIDFSTFVAFFPQLVAGPIERASNLLPQFKRNRIFQSDQAISGLYLILWGLFKKIVIADSCATYVNTIFNNYENMNSLSLILGAIYFSFQIYADFSGYTDIAIGVARLFGFELMRNFNYPYFSRNIGEFWRRWHISLSTWFRDYLYIPLGGSRGSLLQTVRNVVIIFLISGLWHGANWTFIIWGGIHACLFIPLVLKRKNRSYLNPIDHNQLLPSFKEVLQMLFTFSLVTVAWIFFRAESATNAMDYIIRIFVNQQFKIQYLSSERYNIELGLLLLTFISIEWFNRNHEHPFFGKFKWQKIFLITIMLLTLGVYSDHSEFIYFQF